MFDSFAAVRHVRPECDSGPRYSSEATVIPSTVLPFGQ